MKKVGKRATASSQRPGVVFLVKCLAYWASALLLVSRFSFVEEWGVNLTLFTLQKTMGLFGQHIERAGSALYTRNASIEIVSECSPHMPFLIYAAVILAFPSTWKQRGVGLLFGGVVIHLFNTLRIMTLIWVLAWRRNWFDLVHVYLWQTGTILIIFITFALWIRSLPRRRPEAA
jgi:exosortase/archaeosortase family protein